MTDAHGLVNCSITKQLVHSSVKFPQSFFKNDRVLIMQDIKPVEATCERLFSELVSLVDTKKEVMSSYLQLSSM